MPHNNEAIILFYPQYKLPIPVTRYPLPITRYPLLDIRYPFEFVKLLLLGFKDGFVDMTLSPQILMSVSALPRHVRRLPSPDR